MQQHKQTKWIKRYTHTYILFSLGFVETISLPYRGVPKGVFLADHLASTDKYTKTTNTHEHKTRMLKSNKISVTRNDTNNTRKKILGLIDRTENHVPRISLPQGCPPLVHYYYTHRNSAPPGVLLGSSIPLWPLKAPECTVGEGRQASHQSSDAITFPVKCLKVSVDITNWKLQT